MQLVQKSLADVIARLATEPKLLKLLGRPKKVDLLCTTCRDGGQTRSLTWTAEDKMSVISQAVRAGLRHIEVGWPVPSDKVNPEVFRQLLAQRKRYHQLGVTFYAFMGTVKPNKPGERILITNPMIKSVLDTGVSHVVVFGKSWKLHVQRVLEIRLAENLRIIEETVAALVSVGKTVIYDAEHAVDGWRDDRRYFFKTLSAAINGGARRIVLCDTRGGTLPAEWLAFLLDVVPWLKDQGVEWGVHTHNDSGMGDANSLLAVELGCDHVQGTIGGIGERTGNANLTTIIPSLVLKMGIAVVTAKQLTLWTALTRYVYNLAGIEIPFNLPVAGPNAFHHEGGTHSHAWLKDPDSVEHIRAAMVGNQTSLGLSNQAGRTLMRVRLAEFIRNLAPSDPRIGELLDKVHGLERDGWLFETAEGSFRLLALRQLDRLQPFFTVTMCELTERIPPYTGLPGETLDRQLQNLMLGSPKATVQVELADGRTIGLKTAKGDGLVNALDKALRQALQERGGRSREPVFPELVGLELVNYNVKALINHDGTAARVRVILFWRIKNNGDEIWGTVAVSESVTEASARALAAGYQYFLHCHRR
ncbi:MAG: alpha-isopropylmalate synthase regulatory domain-containing protein [Patescibacteria group bacterium]